MAANPLGSLELAMTHFADGRACERPSEVRSMVSRLMGWEGHPETCQSCSAARALYVVNDEALCARCREQRSQRMATMESLNKVVSNRSDPASGATLVGHAIVFDSWSLDLGGFIERIRPQAANRIINEQSDIRTLWNHNTDIPLARTSAKSMRYWKDSTGVAVSVVPPSWASNHVESVQRGDVTGMSFGFRKIEDEWTMDGHIPQRDLLDMLVSEFSAVAFPAYPATDIRVGQGSNRLSWLTQWHKTRVAR